MDFAASHRNLASVRSLASHFRILSLDRCVKLYIVSKNLLGDMIPVMVNS